MTICCAVFLCLYQIKALTVKMPSCAVYGCSNTNRKTKGTGIRYFSFPNNPDLINKWLTACKRKDKVNVKYACVCSQHFNASSYHITMRQRLLNYVAPKCRILKPDAVPTENLPSCVGDKKARTDSNTTDSQEVVAIDLFNEKTDQKQVDPVVVRTEPIPDVISATLNVNHHAEIERLKLKIEQLEKENSELKVKVDELSRKNKFILRAVKKCVSDFPEEHLKKSSHSMFIYKYKKKKIS